MKRKFPKQLVSPLSGSPTLGNLKVHCLYLEFPLRCISLGPSGAEQQQGEKGDPVLSLCGRHKSVLVVSDWDDSHCRDSLFGFGKH